MTFKFFAAFLILVTMWSAPAWAVPASCRGVNLNQFMVTGQPSDAPPDKIYRFTVLRTQLVQSISRSQPNAACYADFYKSALNEEGAYWGQRLAQEGCTISANGTISGSCPSASEARRSTQFINTLDRELKNDIDERLDAHDDLEAEANGARATAGDPNCPARRPAGAGVQQLHDQMCCGTSADQGGVIRAVEAGINYNTCLGKIRPTGQRFFSGGGIAACLGNAISAAAHTIWDSITSIFKLPGELWAARSQIWSLITSSQARAQFASKMMQILQQFFTDRVEAFKCYNSYEKAQFACRLGGQIIATCALPETMGAFIGLVAKPVGAAARALGAIMSRSGRGGAVLNRLARGTAAARRAASAVARPVRKAAGVADRATGRIVSRTAGGLERARALIGRPLSRVAEAAAKRIESSRPYNSILNAAYRAEQRAASAARAAQAGRMARAGGEPVTIDGATGRIVDPETVPPDSTLKSAGSSTVADREAAAARAATPAGRAGEAEGGGAVVVRNSETPSGGAAPRAGEPQGGAVVVRNAEPQGGSVVVRNGEPQAAPVVVRNAEPQSGALVTRSEPLRGEVLPPERNLTLPSPAPNRVANFNSEVPVAPARLPAPQPRAQALLPAPTRAATNVESTVARTGSTVNTAATDVRAAATTGTKVTAIDNPPPTVTTSSSNLALNSNSPAAVGVRTGGGSSGGASVFTGGGSTGAADAGVASRAGLGSSPTSKLDFAEGRSAPAGAATRPAVAEARVGGSSSGASGGSVGGSPVATVEEGSTASVASRSASTGERPVYTREVKAPVREGGAPTNAESSAFNERPSTAKVAPEKVNKRLATADREALAELDLPSLRGDAKLKPKSRYDDVAPKDRGARVSELQETKIEIENRLAGLKPETREQVFTHLKEIPADKAHLRDSHFAAILNSQDEAATIARLNLATKNPPLGRRAALRKIDTEINTRTAKLLDSSLSEEAKLAVASERSALLFERTIVDFGDNIRVRNIYSSNTHNRFLDLEKSYEPHSLGDTFNADLEVTGKGVKVCRGSYATEGALSSVAGGFYTICRSNNYLSREANSEVLATPNDLTLPGSEQGVSRYTSFEAKEGTQFSLGQNGPVRYNKKGQVIDGSGGSGGSVEFFCSRSPNCVKLEDIADSVRVPTCKPGTPGCDRIFKIQEEVRFSRVIEERQPGAVLSERRAQTQQIIRDMTPEHDRLAAELAKPDFNLLKARAEHPELVSAINLDREIGLKINRIRGGNLSPRKLDADTQALFDLEINSTTKFNADLEARLPRVAKDQVLSETEQAAQLAKVRRAVNETVDNAGAPARLRDVETSIQSQQARLAQTTDAAKRREIASDLIRLSEDRSDILLSFKRIEDNVKSKIKGLDFLSSSEKTAIIEESAARIRALREPRTMVARVEKVEPATPPTSVAGARAPPKAPLRVLDDAPSYTNEIELLAKRDGLSARDFSDAQIESYARDLRITNGNMARDIEYKPITTKRDLDAVVAKALPDAGIDTDRLRRMMSYRPQSGYLSGADFAEARKFTLAVQERGVSNLDRLPLSKFERETLNKVMDRAPMYGRQIDADIPKLGRLSTEAQVERDVAAEAAAAAKKAEVDAQVARAEARLNAGRVEAPERAPSYANEIEVLAKRDGVSALNSTERQLENYAADLRITNGNMTRAIEYKPITTRAQMQDLVSKIVPEGVRIDTDRLRRMMSFKPQSGYLNGSDFAEAKKFMQAVESRGGVQALDQLPLTKFERENLNKIMDRAPMYARQLDPALPVKMGRVNVDPAAVVMPAQKADRFIASFKEKGLDPKAATALTDADRIAVAEKVTGRKLKPAERDAVIKAHNIDCGGFSVNNPCNANKGITLRRAGFDQNQTRELMQMGVTGSEGTKTASLLDEVLEATPESRVRVAREPQPAAEPTVAAANLRIQKAEAAYNETLANPTSTIEARLGAKRDIETARRSLAEAQQREGRDLLNELIEKPSTAKVDRAAAGEGASAQATAVSERRAANEKLRSQLSPEREQKMQQAFAESGTSPLKQSIEVGDIYPGQRVTYTDSRGAVRSARLSGADPENPSNFLVETTGDKPQKISLKQEDVALTSTEQNLMYKREADLVRERLEARTPAEAKKEFDDLIRRTEEKIKSDGAPRDSAAARAAAQKETVDALVDSVVKRAMANPNDAKIAELRLRAANEGIGTDKWRQTMDEIDGLERPYVPSPKEQIDYYNRGLDEIPSTRTQLSDSELSFVGDILQRQSIKKYISAEESALFARAERVLKYPIENAQKRINEIARATGQSRIEIPRSVFDDVRKLSPYDQQGLGKVEKLFKASTRDAGIGETADLVFDAQRFNSSNFMKKMVAEGKEPYVAISRRINLYDESKKLYGVIQKADELPGVALARYQNTVRLNKKAEDFMAAYRANGLDPVAATQLTDAERIAVAERVSRRSLNPAERDAVIKAHNIDCGGFTVNNPCNVAKGVTLRKAGFTQNETRDLMRMGVTGSQKADASMQSLVRVEAVARDAAKGRFAEMPRAQQIKITNQVIADIEPKLTANGFKFKKIEVDGFQKLEITEIPGKAGQFIRRYTKVRGEQTPRIVYDPKSIIENDGFGAQFNAAANVVEVDAATLALTRSGTSQFIKHELRHARQNALMKADQINGFHGQVYFGSEKGAPSLGIYQYQTDIEEIMVYERQQLDSIKNLRSLSKEIDAGGAAVFKDPDFVARYKSQINEAENSHILPSNMTRELGNEAKKIRKNTSQPIRLVEDVDVDGVPTKKIHFGSENSDNEAIVELFKNDTVGPNGTISVGTPAFDAGGKRLFEEGGLEPAMNYYVVPVPQSEFAKLLKNPESVQAYLTRQLDAMEVATGKAAKAVQGRRDSISELVSDLRKKEIEVRSPASTKPTQPVEPRSSSTPVLSEAQKIAGQKQLIEEFGNVKVTTPEQNRAFIQLKESSKPDQMDRAFLVMDNTKLGDINNVTSNKLLANAITNKHIARVQEAMTDLAKNYKPAKIKLVSNSGDAASGVSLVPYSSFKSGAYAFVTEGGAVLPDEFMSLVGQRMVQLNQEYYNYLRQLDVLPENIDPMFLFRSGLDRTYRDAEQAARQARTISDINRPRSMTEAQIRDQTERSFAMAQLAQQIHANRLKGTDLVAQSMQGKWVLSAKGLDLIKKAKKPEVLAQQIRMTTGVSINEKQAALLIKHKSETDVFIPSTLVETRASPVLDSIHGGINFDLVGAGAEGSYQSQLAIAHSKNVDDLFENAEKGERVVTEILNRRRAAVRAATEPVMKKYGVQGRFVESGDDMAFIAENKPVPQAALDEVVRNLSRTTEPSKVRMSAVGEDIDSVETRMNIGTQGEAIEKSVRARLVGVLPDELQSKIVIAVKMETKKIGSGQARLMLGSDAEITPFQRQQIEKAFQQAAQEFNYTGVIAKPISAMPDRTPSALGAGSLKTRPSSPTTKPPETSP